MPAGAPPRLAGVWLADQLGTAAMSRVQRTGHAGLDAQLPGGGWPVGAMTEVLQPAAGLHAWQLVLPALAQATAARPGAVVLVAPPYEPFAPALGACGLQAARLCRVQAATAAQALWAAEQALRCRDVQAVLAWLPQASPESLRRLQLAAAQMGQLLWVFRPARVRQQASPAPLRLWVDAVAESGGAEMQVQVLKRRGPPMEQALVLPASNAALARALAASAARGEERRAAQPAPPQAAVLPLAAWLGRLPAGGVQHALDRMAIVAAPH
jgi:protein ImuA